MVAAPLAGAHRSSPGNSIRMMDLRGKTGYRSDNKMDSREIRRFASRLEVRFLLINLNRVSTRSEQKCRFPWYFIAVLDSDVVNVFLESGLCQKR